MESLATGHPTPRPPKPVPKTSAVAPAEGSVPVEQLQAMVSALDDGEVEEPVSVVIPEPAACVIPPDVPEPSSKFEWKF